MILQSDEGLTTFNKNNRVNFPSEKRSKWSFQGCLRILKKTLSHQISP